MKISRIGCCILAYAKLLPNLMSDNRDNLTPERRERIRRRGRMLLWVLGATVLLLLAIIVSQQLWLWTVVRPDTPADALVL